MSEVVTAGGRCDMYLLTGRSEIGPYLCLSLALVATVTTEPNDPSDAGINTPICRFWR